MKSLEESIRAELRKELDKFVGEDNSKEAREVMMAKIREYFLGTKEENK